MVRVVLLSVSTVASIAMSEWILSRHRAALIDRQMRSLGIHAGPEGLDPTTGSPWDDTGSSALHVRSENPTLVYELRPGAEVHVPFMRLTVRTNSAGFRDAEFEEAKPAGTRRIAVVGDSIAFGWWLSREETFPKRLESRFAREFDTTSCRIQVYNFAVGGYNTEQEIELIRSRVLAYEPDVIVLAYSANDDDIGADAGLWMHFNRKPLVLLELAHLYTLRIAEWVRPGDITTRGLARLGEIAGQHGIEPFLLVFPLLDGETGFARAELVAREARRHEIRVIDLRTAYNRFGFHALRILPGDSLHPNALGHEIAARELYEALEPAPSLQCDSSSR